MGLTWSEVYTNGLLSDDLMNCIPQECECGGEVMFTESLRQIYCSNPKCYCKVAARLEAMAKAMKVDGFGESTCIELCRELHIVSPFQAFLLDRAITNGYTRNLSVAALDKKVDALLNSPARSAELWEMVKYAGIPNLEQNAYKIFNGYDSIEDAYKDIERGQVPFIAERLGIKSSESSVLAVSIYNSLIEYKEELLFGETQFDIRVPEGDTILIVITGGVRGYRNKGAFIDSINRQFAGKINAMLVNSVSKQIDVLVADGDTSSNKYKSAININKKYMETGLINGDFIEAEVGEYEDDIELAPIGEKILITTSEGLIERLEQIYG